jgi:hypothetical protein
MRSRYALCTFHRALNVITNRAGLGAWGGQPSSAGNAVETMHGHFTLQTSVRKGAPLPTGTSLTVFLSANTGYVVGVDLSNEAPAPQTLTRLGAVRSVG